MKHHPNSPSALYRRENCPGSRRMEDGLTEIPSDKADVGTRLHAAVAQKIETGHMDPPLSPEDAALVDKCITFLKRTQRAKVKVLVEQSVTVRQIVDGYPTGEILTTGTADAMALSAYTAEDGTLLGWAQVWDWKFHHTMPPAEELELQIPTYVEGAIQEHECDAGEGWFYFPRLDDFVHYTVQDDGTKLLERLQNIVDATEAHKDKVGSGLESGPWCKYCKAAGHCPELTQQADGLVKAFDAAPKPTKKAMEESFKEQLRRVPASELQAMLDRLHPLEAAVAAVRARAMELLEHEPECLDGWKRLERNGNRSADALELWQSIDSSQGIQDGITKEQFLQCCTVSVPQVEKLLGPKVMERLQTAGIIKQGKRFELRKAKKK